jgi:DNA-binding MarR family transcriptional regulator
MAGGDSLSAMEEVFWRALMRIVVLLPRRCDGDLLRAVGISVNEYLTLMSLSEAPRSELRMSDLAQATALSASRMTRLVDELEGRGLVVKRASSDDGRGHVASLTWAGLAKLRAGEKVHVTSVRALVFDHVDTGSTNDTAQALWEIAARLRGGP